MKLFSSSDETGEFIPGEDRTSQVLQELLDEHKKKIEEENSEDAIVNRLEAVQKQIEKMKPTLDGQAAWFMNSHTLAIAAKMFGLPIPKKE